MSVRTDELLEKAVVALERNATASEQLIALATEERDYGDFAFGPPICVHCATLNPTINIHSHVYEGAGDMGEFVLVAQCNNCTKTMYAVPQGWVPFANAEDANKYLSERGGNQE